MGVFIEVGDLPTSVDGDFQVLFLFLVYGYILFTASNMISDGSELLLLIPSVAGIVGSVVLPVLGAVPDAAIVLFSGLGSDAQSELSVGIGALAGSTIMLLTIPWFLSVRAGRVNIDKTTGFPVYKRPHGQPFWRKLDPSDNADLRLTGVAGSSNLQTGGILMLITAVPYIIIQGCAMFHSGESTDEIARGEKYFALAGLLVCSVLFFAYLYYQYWLAYSDNAPVLEDYTEEVWRARIISGEISLMGLMRDHLRDEANANRQEENAALAGGATLSNRRQSAAEVTEALLPPKPRKRLEHLLKPFFEKFDTDHSGSLEIGEMSLVFQDLNQPVRQKEIAELFEQFDSDNSGSIDFSEFVAGTAKFVTEQQILSRRESAASHMLEAREEEEQEEVESVPEDLAELSPEEQQRAIILRSLYLMLVGTALVLTFSDPMVDVLDEIGERTGISSFYISFVLAPLASNASELIASYNYAKKKTTKTIQISLSALQGACCLNNTFCLAVFMFLVYFKSLAWAFSAETTAILVIIVGMAAMSQRKVHRLLDGWIVLVLYPLSIIIVVSLEAYGWD